MTTEDVRTRSDIRRTVERSVAFRRILWQLLGATRGGPTRIRILRLLRDQPRNTNQIALATQLDYKTVEHHVRTLRENAVIAPIKEGYGAAYCLSIQAELHLDEFERIAAEVLADRAKHGARS